MSYQPRTIYIKVSTELLAELSAWSDPVRVKIEQQADDTYEMTFRREPFVWTIDESAGQAE